MISLGVGEIIGGTIIGIIRDRAGNKVALASQILLHLAAFALILFLNEYNKFDITAYIMCFFWGLQDSGINCLINCVLGFEFNSKIAPFAVFKLV